MNRAGRLAIVCLALPACAVHTHMDRGAPGHTDLAQPPNMPPGFAQPQQDPGERVIAVTAGPTPSGGLAEVDGRTCGFALVGGELTLNDGTNERSHNEDDFFLLPWTGRGVSVGGGLMILSDGPQRGPVYAEIHGFDELTGLAGGWALDAVTLDTGPQLTAWFGPMFLRATVYLDGTVFVSGGSQIKLPLHAWVWSR